MTDYASMTLAERLAKYPNCPVPVSSFTSFTDEGKIHFRAGHYRKALFCYDRALQLRPNDEGALIARSQCHLKLGDAQAALKDAETSFTNNENKNIMGLFQYGEALFNLGQFEQALIAYHRGYRRRKDKEEFRNGVNKAQCAMKKAVGDRQATQIEDLDKILFEVEEMNAVRGPEHCSVLAADEHKAHSHPRSKKANALSFARSRWVDRETMGILQQDKDYLTKFLKRPDIRGDAQNSSEGLRNDANEALKYLEIRQDFWRQQNPMYSRKIGLNFNNDMVRRYERQEKEKLEASTRIKMDAAQGAVLKNLAHIEHALQIGRAQDCRLECERAIRQLKEISHRLLPRKPEFMTEILHYKGLAFMKLKNYDGACAAFQEEFKVASENNMAEAKSRALDYLGRSFALKGSFPEAAEIWDSKLAISKTHIERAYLFHEIARCYYETHKFELARMLGNQCLEEALKIKDNIWAMNAEILLAQCEIITKAFDKAIPHIELAERYALFCNNKANISMLREALHCIKIYLEKQDAGVEPPPESEQGSGGSDDEKSILDQEPGV